MTIKQQEEIVDYSIVLLNKYFPKLNQDNTSIASSNHRGEAIALVAGILTKIYTISREHKDK